MGKWGQRDLCSHKTGSSFYLILAGDIQLAMVTGPKLFVGVKTKGEFLGTATIEVVIVMVMRAMRVMRMMKVMRVMRL